MIEVTLSRRPAMRLASLLILGILLAHGTSVVGAHAFQLTAAVYLVTLIVTLWKRTPVFSAIGLHVCIVALGFALHQFQRERVHAKIVKPQEFEEPVIALGTVESDLIPQGDFHRFMLKSTFLSRETGLQRLERRFLVLAEKAVTATPVDSLEFGTLVAFEAILRSLPRPRNPGEFDYGRYLELNDIHGVLSVEKDAVVRVVTAESFSFQKVVARSQKFLHGIIDRFHTKENASFVNGVALGYREDISLEMKQAFIDTGTIHILAVSGSNVAVVALMFYSLFGFFRLSRRMVTVAVVLGLLFYMMITGMSPSVMRATIMAIVILIGMSIERKTDIYNSLSVAAVILLLWDTNYLFDVGFQLSFAAVFSIVYFYPILNRLIEKIPEWLEEVKGIDFVLKLFAVSLAAQLGTLPFSAYYFGKISLVSFLANLVVVPVSGINTLLGFTVIIFSFASDFAAACYAALNGLLVGFLLGFVKAAASVPLAFVETSTMTFSTALVYFAIVAALFNLRNTLLLKRTTIFLLAAANFFIFAEVFEHGRSTLKLTILDVGQGDAIMIDFPNRSRLLVDAGPQSLRRDAGESVVAPFLKRNGMRSLDALLI
ncbi:MAG: ComEC/Rec2 family competence protein, partial [Ignavibacteriales bacterium]|nr:ComEC/Rec2 family competence protein [Ignavibacteriales bacterium]